jgi:acetyl-CoA acetyltransferase
MTTLKHERRRHVAPVHVVGLAATPFRLEHDAMPDELVFDVVRAALRECGLRKQDSGLSVLASMDVLDGRSISSGLSTGAAGGYLNDSYRVEGDSGVAVLAAAHAVAAGDVDVAIAVGVHNPETCSADPDLRRAFLAQVSNLAFEPHVDRPVGLTSEVVYGLHAAHQLRRGLTSMEELADLAAAEITRGAGLRRSVRNASVSREDVLASPASAWPLHELMLPAHSTGAVAVVLASPARAGRSLGRSARLTGFGHATGRYTGTGQWLDDAVAPTRRAAAMAYAHAGLGSRPAADLVELSAASPALHAAYLEALGLAHTVPAERINASGGLRSNYPGLANGALRLLECVEQLDRLGARRAVSHSVDTITGTVSEDVTVMVVEAA